MSTSTTPAGARSRVGQQDLLLEAVDLDHQQQQQAQGQQLQQQPTMPEAWLSALTDLGLESGGQQARSSISLSGRAGLASASSASGGTAPEDPGLMQLKQAFAQQLMVQHSSSAGDDLL